MNRDRNHYIVQINDVFFSPHLWLLGPFLPLAAVIDCSVPTSFCLSLSVSFCLSIYLSRCRFPRYRCRWDYGRFIERYLPVACAAIQDTVRALRDNMMNVASAVREEGEQACCLLIAEARDRVDSVRWRLHDRYYDRWAVNVMEVLGGDEQRAFGRTSLLGHEWT